MLPLKDIDDVYIQAVNILRLRLHYYYSIPKIYKRPRLAELQLVCLLQHEDQPMLHFVHFTYFHPIRLHWRLNERG